MIELGGVTSESTSTVSGIGHSVPLTKMSIQRKRKATSVRKTKCLVISSSESENEDKGRDVTSFEHGSARPNITKRINTPLLSKKKTTLSSPEPDKTLDKQSKKKLTPNMANKRMKNIFFNPDDDINLSSNKSADETDAAESST